MKLASTLAALALCGCGGYAGGGGGYYPATGTGLVQQPEPQRTYWPVNSGQNAIIWHNDSAPEYWFGNDHGGGQLWGNDGTITTVFGQ